MAQEASISLINYLAQLGSEREISCSKICFQNDGLSQFFKSTRSYSDNHKGVMELDLTAKPSDLVWTRILNTSERKRIKRFDKEGVRIWEANTKSDLARFLEVYYSN